MLRSLLPILACVTVSRFVWAQPAGARCWAEWQPARKILVYTPGEELFYGVVHPAAALFERSFSTKEAAAEHRNWIEQLQSEGIRVYNVRDVLLDGTFSPASGALLPGSALDRLRALARRSIDVVCEGFPDQPGERQAQAEYLDATLRDLAPEDLWRIVVLRPRVHLTSTGNLNTGYVADYQVRPVMNLYFTRDQMITTARGVVLGRMNSVQRQVETDIMRATLDALGIAAIYRVQEPGRLEGGDFLPAGDRVFLGQGLRTNAHAVKQLLANDVFGTEEVVVVKDRWQNQEQMHLDTYFNVIGPKHVLMVETRLTVGVDGRSRECSPEMTLLADVYRKSGGTYRLVRQDVDFEAYLRDDLKLSIIPVSANDQARYGVNVLTIGPKRIMGVEGVSEGYKRRLGEAGIECDWIDFSALSGGYGACHCTTQVLLRGEPGN